MYIHTKTLPVDCKIKFQKQLLFFLMYPGDIYEMQYVAYCWKRIIQVFI